MPELVQCFVFPTSLLDRMVLLVQVHTLADQTLRRMDAIRDLNMEQIERLVCIRRLHSVDKLLLVAERIQLMMVDTHSESIQDCPVHPFRDSYHLDRNRCVAVHSVVVDNVAVDSVAVRSGLLDSDFVDSYGDPVKDVGTDMIDVDSDEWALLHFSAAVPLAVLALVDPTLVGLALKVLSVVALASLKLVFHVIQLAFHVMQLAFHALALLDSRALKLASQMVDVFVSSFPYSLVLPKPINNGHPRR